MASFTLTSGADTFPGAGVNVLGADEIFGLEGNDILASGNGDDTLHGGEDNDLLKGGQGADVLNGDAGVDRLYGGGEDDILNGGTEADTLWGQDGDDTLNGGDGNDVMYGGLGADAFDGGDGNDVVSYRYATAGVTVDLWGGPGSSGEALGDSFASVERIQFSAFNDRYYGHDGANATLLMGDGADLVGGAGGALLAYGGAGNDVLYGGWAADRLYGQDGDDSIDGGDGDDILDGGLGYDGVEGGAGNDRIYGVGLLNGGADNDVITVRSTAQVYANAHGNDGDDRIYGGTGTDYLFGDAGNDALYAGNLNNGLYGGDGNDRLFTEFGGSDLNGEAGDDFMQARADETAWTEFDGGTGFDTVSYRNAVGDSWDRGVSISGDRGQTGAATNDWYISVEKFVLSDFDDTLIGNTMSVSGQAFEARGYDGNDDLRGGAGLDSLFGGDGDDDLAGNAADDHLYGGAGTDDLKGGDGIDTLDGGGSSTGADVLAGGAGADTFVFKVGHGSVDLTDYVWGEDRLDVATFVAGSHTWFMVGHGPDTEVVFSTGDTIVFRGVDTTVVQQIMDEATGPGDVFEPMTPPDRLGLETHGDHDVAAPAFVLAGGEWLLAG